jgi:multicomponent Na+:H+ antiporter subunit F
MVVGMVSIVDVLLAVLVIVMLVAIGRTIWGPSHADRALAVDFGFAIFVAGLALLAVRLETRALLDLVLAATLVGFLGTVAFAKLVERGGQNGGRT